MMTRLFQFVSAVLLGLALIVPAAAQEGKRPKSGEGKRPVDIDRTPKSDSRGRNGGGGNRERGGQNDNRGNRDRDNDRRDNDRRGNRPNGIGDDL